MIVQRRTQAPNESATLDGASELRDAPPGLVGAGALELCSGPVLDPGAVAELSLGVEGELNYLAWDSAWRRARGALRRLSCLTGPTRPEEVARLYWLAGVAAWQARQPSEAERLFARAIEANEALAWDPMHGQEGRSTFDAVREGERTTALLEWTAPEWESAWIDGAPAASGAPIGVGWHLLQLEGEGGQVSMLVQVEQPGTRVVVPAAFPEDWSVRMDEPELRTEVDQLLALVYPEGETVWMPGKRGSTWRTVVGTRSWSRARPSTSTARWATLGAGAGLATVGAIGVVWSAEQGLAANKAMQVAPTEETWQSATRIHEQAQNTNALSWITLGAGVVTLSVAAAPLPIWTDAHVAPWFTPGGGGLSFGGRW